uniref:Uncharacterized protein n=1 Tax=Panagrellus redivivus TaxID=6233 RepID=A0A7E4VXF9_PANRE
MTSNARADVVLLCGYCQRHVDADRCNSYPTLVSRLNRCWQKKLCRLCLGYQGKTLYCTSLPKSCCYCGQFNHHKSLCFLNPFFKTSSSNINLNTPCEYCQKHADASVCKEYDTYKARVSRILERRLCYLCLKQHSRLPYCATPPCLYCTEGDHHYSICRLNPNLKENFENDPLKGICFFCEAHVDPTKCTKVNSIQKRRDILTAKGRCFKCFRFHKTESCAIFNSYACYICQSTEHNGFVCPYDPALFDSDVWTTSTSDAASSQMSGSEAAKFRLTLCSASCGSSQGSSSTSCKSLPSSPTPNERHPPISSKSSSPAPSVSINTEEVHFLGALFRTCGMDAPDSVSGASNMNCGD